MEVQGSDLKWKDKFWKNVYIHPFAEDLCWIWSGLKNPKGYGKFKLNKINRSAHRVSYHLFHPEWSLDSSLHVLHHCDVPNCINISHLFIGTNNDNVKDKVKKGRQAKGLTLRLKASKGHKNKTSKYPGVSWFKRDKKWRAYICLDKGKKQYHLGYFIKEEDAYEAYQKALHEIKND